MYTYQKQNEHVQASVAEAFSLGVPPPLAGGVGDPLACRPLPRLAYVESVRTISPKQPKTLWWGNRGKRMPI